jgi:hypothetical protein
MSKEVQNAMVQIKIIFQNSYIRYSTLLDAERRYPTYSTLPYALRYSKLF